MGIPRRRAELAPAGVPLLKVVRALVLARELTVPSDFAITRFSRFDSPSSGPCRMCPVCLAPIKRQGDRSAFTESRLPTGSLS
jgi:hypothetical protein